MNYAFDLALKLEMMGKGEELGGAGEVFSSLSEEMGRLRTSIEDLSVGDDQ